MTEVVTKKKKKIDFVLLRKLEDEYDEAVEDAERKERHLIERAHAEYLKAENKGEFFEELRHAESWYYAKFKDYGLSPELGDRSQQISEGIAKQKIESIVDDLEEMEETPILEVSEELKQDTDYKDPLEERKEWIEKTKQELIGEEPKKIIEDSKFGKYQATKQMLSKARDVSKFDFDVGNKYRPILIHQLKKTIEYLNKLLGEIEDEGNKRLEES